jgi:hypothetical protein
MATPFASIAEEYRRAHGIDPQAAGDDALATLFERDYLTAAIGLFDVRYPKGLISEPRRATDLVHILGAAVDVQTRWFAWRGETGEAVTELEALGKWLDGAKSGALVSAGKDGARDLFKLLGANDEVLARRNKIAQAMLDGSWLGIGPDPTEPLPKIVISPVRGDFISLASFVGSLDDPSKKFLWVESLPGWSDFRCHGLQTLALEYGSAGQKDWTKGTDMNEHEPRGQLQHVAQKMSELIVRRCLVPRLDGEVLDGLSTNLVIDLYGENNSRGSGSGAGTGVGAYSHFVPGGRASGGTLSRKSADTRWRASRGRDHFLPTLRSCQRVGGDVAAKAKRGARGDIMFFAMEDAMGGPPPLVQAPLFGEGRPVQEIVESAKQDYFDFLRAYRSAFAFWLQTKATGADAAAAPAALFAKLIAGAGATPDEVYGVPLSSKDLSADCLELRFLKWLATQK